MNSSTQSTTYARSRSLIAWWLPMKNDWRMTSSALGSGPAMRCGNSPMAGWSRKLPAMIGRVSIRLPSRKRTSSSRENGASGRTLIG